MIWLDIIDRRAAEPVPFRLRCCFQLAHEVCDTCQDTIEGQGLPFDRIEARLLTDLLISTLLCMCPAGTNAGAVLAGFLFLAYFQLIFNLAPLCFGWQPQGMPLLTGPMQYSLDPCLQMWSH